MKVEENQSKPRKKVTQSSTRNGNRAARRSSFPLLSLFLLLFGLILPSLISSLLRVPFPFFPQSIPLFLSSSLSLSLFPAFEQVLTVVRVGAFSWKVLPRKVVLLLSLLLCVILTLVGRLSQGLAHRFRAKLEARKPAGGTGTPSISVTTIFWSVREKETRGKRVFF